MSKSVLNKIFYRICLPVRLCVCPSTGLPVGFSACPPVGLSACLSVQQPAYRFVCLSIWPLPVCLHEIINDCWINNRAHLLILQIYNCRIAVADQHVAELRLQKYSLQVALRLQIWKKVAHAHLCQFLKVDILNFNPHLRNIADN